MYICSLATQWIYFICLQNPDCLKVRYASLCVSKRDSDKVKSEPSTRKNKLRDQVCKMITFRKEIRNVDRKQIGFVAIYLPLDQS